MTSSTPLFSNAIKELRIHLCQTSPASVGLRAFILEQYQSLKKDHPNLPMLIRECQGTEARVFARYAFGRERKISLNNVPKKEIPNLLKQFNEPFEEEMSKSTSSSKNRIQIQ